MFLKHCLQCLLQRKSIRSIFTNRISLINFIVVKAYDILKTTTNYLIFEYDQ